MQAKETKLQDIIEGTKQYVIPLFQRTYSYWQPMQSALTDSLTEYIRHFLMRNGNIVKQNDVYYVLKEKVSPENAIDYLKELKIFSDYYQRLLFPEFEPDKDLQKYFQRLNRIEVTTAYPLLMSLYDSYAKNKISKNDFITILKIIENYLIRRFVCNIPSHGLNKIFPTIYPQLTAKYSDNFVEGIKNVLQSKGYPKDNEFYLRFKETKFYGAGDRHIKTKLILETIEESFSHKETVSFENLTLTLEHIMPQTLSEWWQHHLGEEWEDTHELFLHTIGNLTLSAYNSDLSNDDFTTKKMIYGKSHLELNKYFSSVPSWTRTEIETRSEILAKQAIEIWSYFGQENSASSALKENARTVPEQLTILGQQFQVQTWRDVLEQTLNTIAELEPEKFEMISNNFPRYVGKDKNKFRAIRQLKNDYYIEVNMSAQSIKKFCYQAMETIDLSSDEWNVVVTG